MIGDEAGAAVLEGDASPGGDDADAKAVIDRVDKGDGEPLAVDDGVTDSVSGVVAAVNAL